jgi:predicted HAD superfamily Cof-like phosphohydrolase
MNEENSEIFSKATFWPADIFEMHQKFGVHQVVNSFEKEKLEKFLEFRLNFLMEELKEAYDAAGYSVEVNVTKKLNGLKGQAEDVVDAMIDLCVVAVGTLDAYGIDAYTAWNRVHEKNMEKSPGIKKGRPNPLGLPDLIKPEGWTAPTHADNIGLLSKVFE